MWQTQPTYLVTEFHPEAKLNAVVKGLHWRSEGNRDGRGSTCEGRVLGVLVFVISLCATQPEINR